ncbi:hypothetical protein BCR22_07375 [Enterococcus plantarum]|uniref:hypothetical protein n=1 Tax=Enterococcus plantarum TaxID=1077675 RepID=UPI00084DC946|nr:hypothetical protein [Enterococcus plantarum]OEG09407.1 hypothetical protein BCR22_07375 [Enterococcus plantarum]
MRYNTKVTFVTEKNGYYDPEIGEHIEPSKTEKTKRVNMTDLGTDRSVKIFGEIDESAKVIRLLRPYNKKWDYVMIDNRRFELVTKRSLPQKNTFILKEVIKDG